MKKWQYIFGLLVILLVVFGGYYFYRLKQNSNQPGARVDFELVDRSNYGLYASLSDDGHKNLSATLFSDTAEWKRFWENEIRNPGTGGFESFPPIDFSQKTVLAILQGVKPTGGYYIQIDELSTQGNKIIAKVIINEPEQKDSQTQAVSAPYDVVKFDKAVLEGKKNLEIWDIGTGKIVLTKKL